MSDISDFKPKAMLALFILALISSGTLAPAVAQSTTTNTYGGPARDAGSSIVKTSDGGYAIAGQTQSYGIGYIDMYLIKTDANGNLLWNKTFGGLDEDTASDIVQSSDGGYVLVGYSATYGLSGDIYLVKTDQSGNLEWFKTYGGMAADYGYSITLTEDGGYAIAGQTYSFGRGGDFYVVKTDPNGNEEWSNNYGGQNNECPYSIIVTNDGGFAIAGYTGDLDTDSANVYLVKTFANGTLQWARSIGGANNQVGQDVIQITNDNGYAIVGTSGPSFAANVYLVKTNINGTYQWGKTYGGAGDETGTSLVMANDGGFALAGYTNVTGNMDIYFVRTDAGGNFYWSKTYGGPRTEVASEIIRVPIVGYAIAGLTESFGSGNADVYLLFIDASGMVVPEFSPVAMLVILVTITSTVKIVLGKTQKFQVAKPKQTS